MENDYVETTLLGKISRELDIRVGQIRAVLKLLEEGSTVPFIARYRKEVTGNLDEDQIRAIYQEWDYGQKLFERKEAVLKAIEAKGKLTDELRDKIINSVKLSEVEDLYLPYKEKKKTRATDAKAKGLEPLAIFLLEFSDIDPTVKAEEFVTKEVTEELTKEGKVVKNVKEALQGAMDIIAEMVSDNADYRAFLRKHCNEKGLIKTEVKDDADDEKLVYEMYYHYEEPIKQIKLHRVLAINRAEDEKVIKVTIVKNLNEVMDYFYTDLIKREDSPSTVYVKTAIDDAYKRLIEPSIDREIRSDLKEKAENQAIMIFGENLKNYLLTPPIKGKVVLGLDPAFRTGCKLAVVDATGKFLDKDVIYPHQKNPGEKVPEGRIDNARYIVKFLLKEYGCEIVTIGNGTASRESEQFISSVLREYNQENGTDVKYVIVNEAGASVYSASKLAQEEFPDFSVEERSAVSIARRLQDPLAELVKIDPQSIGVGQYQHDVTQSKLADQLNFVVETAVNKVGVNVNTASVSLLKYVAGLNQGTAKKLVEYRDTNGKYASRKDLKIKGVTEKTLEQAYGFLRINDGTEPFDATSIHPESYEVASKILETLGFTKEDLGKQELIEAIKTADRSKLVETLGVGEYTLNDILDAFIAPTRDPRETVEAPILRSDALSLEDLQVGMELQGTVRNVCDFGAFVDCGVHDDGLVHLSKMSNKFIKHPLDVVSVGDIVKVWVLEVDLKKHRLQLTMIDPNQPKPQPKKDYHKDNQEKKCFNKVNHQDKVKNEKMMNEKLEQLSKNWTGK